MVRVSRIILLNFDCSTHIKAWLHLVYVLLLLLLCFLPVVSTKLLQDYHLPILYPPICPYTLVNLTKMVLGLAVDCVCVVRDTGTGRVRASNITYRAN